MATITEVKVTKDLRRARIYFTLAGGKELSEQTAQGFRSAAGFIKRHLGPRLGLRYMPELDFFYDESFDHGARIDQLLKSISSSDHGPDHTEN
jgi:ribosome-binding factor A